MSELGQQIKERRSALGLSKAGLARLVGVTDVAVGYWESGEISQIGHERLLRLAAVLGCTVSELLGDPGLLRRDAEVIGDLALRLDREGDELLDHGNDDQKSLGRKRKYAANVLANETNRLLAEEEKPGPVSPSKEGSLSCS